MVIVIFLGLVLFLYLYFNFYDNNRITINDPDLGEHIKNYFKRHGIVKGNFCHDVSRRARDGIVMGFKSVREFADKKRLAQHLEGRGYCPLTWAGGTADGWWIAKPRLGLAQKGIKIVRGNELVDTEQSVHEYRDVGFLSDQFGRREQTRYGIRESYDTENY